MPSSSSGMMLCSLESSEPLTVVPLVLPRSRTIQIPFMNRSLQCLPETFSKSRRMSQLGPPADHDLGLGQGDRVAATDRMHDPKNVGERSHGFVPRFLDRPSAGQSANSPDIDARTAHLTKTALTLSRDRAGGCDELRRIS